MSDRAGLGKLWPSIDYSSCISPTQHGQWSRMMRVVIRHFQDGNRFPIPVLEMWKQS